jgi:hypothetical protein
LPFEKTARLASGEKPNDRGEVAATFSRSALWLIAGAATLSTATTVNRVMLVVRTAVEGAPGIEIWTRAFWTAMAATPHMPASVTHGASV